MIGYYLFIYCCVKCQTFNNKGNGNGGKSFLAAKKDINAQNMKARASSGESVLIKTQNLKGLTVNLVQGLFKQCSHVQICLLFCGTNPYG